MSGTWTVEFWVYMKVGATQQSFANFCVSSYSGINFWVNTSNQLVVDDGLTSQSAFTGGTLAINLWNHVAFVRNVTTTTGYINGVAVGSNSFTPSTVSAINIGRLNTGLSYFTGYISNFRTVIGTAVYTGNFTPPTAPVTAIGSTSAASYSSTANVNVTFPEANTSLLCNFTNAGIIDNAMMFNLETVGDAKISTTQSKFGGTSMFFDGTGDYLAIPSNTTLALGSNDFTIECWVYIQTSVANNGIFHLSTSAWPAASSGIALSVNGASGWGIYYNGTSANGGTQPSLNTWYHTALVRSGTSLKLYVNGAATITVTDSASYTGTFLTIGGYYSTSYLMAGYIDDFRITKGYARYTTNFATPTAEFLDY